MSFDPSDMYLDSGDDYRNGDTSQETEFDDVTAIAETALGLRVKFNETGVQRWLAKKGIRVGSGVQNKGDTGTLKVHAWLVEKWDDEPDGPGSDAVFIPNCVCLRGSTKAILVSLPDGREEWIPLTQLDEASEVKNDSDSGMLVVTRWIAEQKGLV
jgi:hypothetical protein